MEINKIIELIQKYYLYFYDLNEFTKRKIIHLNKIKDSTVFIQQLSKIIGNEFDPHSKIIDLQAKYYYLPIFLTVLNEKIVTIQDYPDYNLKKGSELTEINDINIGEFLNTEYIKRFRISEILRMTKIMEKIVVSDTQNRIKLGFKNGEVKKSYYFEYVQLRHFSSNQHSRENIKYKDSLKKLDEIYYIKIGSLLNDYIINEAIINIKNVINKSPLIIDIRNNMGGKVELAIKLSELFSVNDFNIFTKSRIKMDKLVIRPFLKELKYPVAILCNNLTGSALEYIFLKSLADSNKISIYGNKTSGFKDIATVYNLNERYKMILTTKKYMDENGEELKEKCFYPQYDIPTTIHDYNQFPDRQLESVIKHIRGV